MPSLGDSSFIATEEKFASVNVDAAKQSYEKRGTDNGKKNSPDEGVKTPDATEAEIIQKIDETARLTKQDLTQHFDRFKERLMPIRDNTWQPLVLIDEVETMPQKAEDKLSDSLKRFENDSAILRQRWKDAKENHKEFRKTNNLVRSAEYETRSSIAWWFAAIITIEATFNASLLWEFTGFLPALGQTALITAVNVLIVAFWMAMCLRYKNHVSPKLNRLTLLCLPALLVVLIFNLGVGHYRDALVEAKAQTDRALSGSVWGDEGTDISDLGFVDYTQKAMESVVESFWDIDSIISALLIIVGIGFFSFATIKWYQVFDLYPGYRVCDMALRKAHEEYVNLVNNTRKKINDQGKDSIMRLADVNTKITNMRIQYHELAGRADGLKKSYIAWCANLQKTQTELLTAYRESNLHARSEPAPKYFNKIIPIDKASRESPDFILEELEENEEIMSSVKRSREDITKIIAKVSSNFEDLVSMDEAD